MERYFFYHILEIWVFMLRRVIYNENIGGAFFFTDYSGIIE